MSHSTKKWGTLLRRTQWREGDTVAQDPLLGKTYGTRGRVNVSTKQQRIAKLGEWVGLFIEPHQPIDQRATDGIIRIVPSVGETCGVKNRMH